MESLGKDGGREGESLEACLVRGGLSEKLAGELDAAFSGIDGGELPEGFKPTGLAMRANSDWMNPVNVVFPLRKVTRLSAADRAEIALHYFDLTISVTERGGTFDTAAAAIEGVVARAYGGSLASIQGEARADIDSFLSSSVGKAIACGKAFRRLLWSHDAPPFGDPEVVAARATDDATVKAKGVRRLLWEVPLWIGSGMLDSGHLLAQDYAAAASHAWVQAGAADVSPVPEDLAEFAARLLAYEEPLAAIVARRIQRLNTTVVESNQRFHAALDGELKLAEDHVANRVVLAGWAATGQGDIIVTSNSKSIPGPALHSNTFNTALFSMEPVDLRWWSAVVAILGGAIVSLCAARFTVKWGITSLVAALVVFFIADGIVFAGTSHTFFTLSVIVPWLGCFVSIQAYRYAVEYRAKLKIKGQFGKFLSQEAVEELQKNPDMLKLGGDEKELCVLFSDIAGFTPISESMSASRLIDFLNDYMGRMCASIKESKGYVDKFIGDAIMAIWGAPVPVPDYSARAVKTAIRNTQSLAAWNRERKERGELEVGARIGLATGPMVAGNMGTEWKLNYTCIGDTVNLGARLEGANKQYGTQVMINELCYQQSKDVIVAHIMDKIAVKGKKLGLPVYHVVGLVGETEPRYVKGCEAYTKGFELYQQEKWAEAIPFFREAKENLPPPYQVKEGPYDLMIERCEHLKDATPEQRMEILHLKAPGDEWDGVWKLTSK
jgi:class 3 adenylate cyclase